MVTYTYRTLFTELVRMLRSASIPDEKQEAAFLLEHLTGRELPRLLMEGDTPALPSVQAQAFALCRKRASGYPLQYLLGEWDFFGLTFSVGEGVLIPRGDTETLVETALGLRKAESSTHMADLCSGSGCIPAAIANHLSGVTGDALEKSPDAMIYLKRNLGRLAPSIRPVLCDVCLPETAAAYAELDLITANPPYLTQEDMQQLQREVTFEPALALLGGEDGLEFYRQITAVWKHALKKGGWLLFEVGMGQHEDVEKILHSHGFDAVSSVQDLAGIFRVVMGKRSV